MKQGRGHGRYRKYIQRVKKKMSCKLEKRKYRWGKVIKKYRKVAMLLERTASVSDRKTEAIQIRYLNRQIYKVQLEASLLHRGIRVTWGWLVCCWGTASSLGRSQALPASRTNERKWEWCSSGAKSFVLVSTRGTVSDYQCCCVTTVLREQRAAIAGAWFR